MKLLRVTPAEVRAMIRKAFAAGKAAGEEHVLHGLKTVARLNGSGAAVLSLAKADAPEKPAAPPDFPGHPHRLLALAMVEAARRGADADALHHLADLSNDPGAFHEAAAGGAVAKAFRKAWAAHLHPRGKDGRFISKGEINAAKSDPAKAEELRAKVRPQDAGKLEDAISGSTDLRNSREVARDAGHAFRRDRAERVKAVKRATGRVLNNEADIEDFAALAHHLPYLTKAELRDARVKMNARFGAGKSPRRDQMVKALVGYALARGEGKTHEEAAGRAEGGRTLAADEKAAVRKYAGTWGFDINERLRMGNLSDPDRESVAALDAAIGASPSGASRVTFRGLKTDPYEVEGTTPRAGEVFALEGYLSTSESEGQAKTFGDRATLRVHVPKGFPALSVDRTNDESGEREHLLPRRTRLRVDGVTRGPGGPVYDVTPVGVADAPERPTRMPRFRAEAEAMQAALEDRPTPVAVMRDHPDLGAKYAHLRSDKTAPDDGGRPGESGRQNVGAYETPEGEYGPARATGTQAGEMSGRPDVRVADGGHGGRRDRGVDGERSEDSGHSGDGKTTAQRNAGQPRLTDPRSHFDRLDQDLTPADQLHAAGVPSDRARAPAAPPDDDHAKERYDAARDKRDRMQQWAQDKPESLAAAGASAAAGRRLGRAVATDAGAEPAGGLRKEVGQGGGGPTKPAAGVSGDTPGTKPLAPAAGASAPTPGPLTPAALASSQTAEKIAAARDAYRTDDLHPDTLALGAKHGVNQPAALRQLQREAAAGGIDPAAVLAEAVGTLTGRTYPSGGGRRNYAPDDLAPYDVQKVAERHRAAGKSSTNPSTAVDNSPPTPDTTSTPAATPAAAKPEGGKVETTQQTLAPIQAASDSQRALAEKVRNRFLSQIRNQAKRWEEAAAVPGRSPEKVAQWQAKSDYWRRWESAVSGAASARKILDAQHLDFGNLSDVTADIFAKKLGVTQPKGGVA